MANIREVMEQLGKVPIPPWVSPRGEIDIKSTDLVDLVLVRILERLKKHSTYDLVQNFTPDFCWMLSRRRIYANNASVGDHKPIVVSIGLNHRDTIKSDIMELFKLAYTACFFIYAETNLEQFLRANRNHFNQLVSQCRFFNNRSDPDDVVMEMFILDGCFIIELFLRNDIPDRRAGDPLFRTQQFLYPLNQDLILHSNQLPFEVLKILFKMSGPSVKLYQHDGDHLRLTRLAFKFLEPIVPNQKLDDTHVDINRIDHDLLSMVYEGLSWLRPKANNNNYNSNIDKDEKDGDDKWNLVKSATELQEFGIEFKMKETNNLVDITLNKGVLHIPRIRIRHGTTYSINMLLEIENSFFHNVHCQGRCLTDYLWFMNSLVKSPNDVQLLRHKNIIDNLSELPDDVAILKFLKDLYSSLVISPNFSYKEICRNLNLHCNHRRNSWLAKLKRDYFNSPWAIISFFAASLLLILTAVQTGFSVTSYYNQS